MKATASQTELKVPVSIQKRAGFKKGDVLEFHVSAQRITITASAATYKPTKSERAAIRKGEAQIAQGESVVLMDLLNELDRSHRGRGKKAARKSSR